MPFKTAFAVLLTLALSSAVAAQQVAVRAQSPAPTLAQQIAATDVRLTVERRQLDRINNQVDTRRAALDRLQRQLAQQRQAEGRLRVQLLALARFTYERKPLLLLQVMQAPSIDRLLADLSQDQAIEENQSQLLDQAIATIHGTERTEAGIRANLRSLQAAAAAARRIAAGTLATRSRLETQLAAERAAALQRQAQQAALAAQLAAASATATNVAAQAQSVVIGAVAPSGGNHFDFGYCTWYVATKRYIPWFGNAIDWWGNAQQYGYAEGQAPEVGAIMVEAISPYGHVAYVESVHPDGSWTVSEMNYYGWDVVDTRTLHPGQDPVVGFIYGAAGGSTS